MRIENELNLGLATAAGKLILFIKIFFIINGNFVLGHGRWIRKNTESRRRNDSYQR